VIEAENGLYNVAGITVIETGNTVTTHVVLEIPDDVLPGEYWVRVSIGDEESRRIKYRSFLVLEK